MRTANFVTLQHRTIIPTCSSLQVGVKNPISPIEHSTQRMCATVPISLILNFVMKLLIRVSAIIADGYKMHIIVLTVFMGMHLLDVPTVLGVTVLQTNNSVSVINNLIKKLFIKKHPKYCLHFLHPNFRNTSKAVHGNMPTSPKQKIVQEMHSRM